MKKSIVLAAALALTSASLFAGVKFSGEFKAGYNFDFNNASKDDKTKDQVFSYYTDDSDNNEGEFDLKVADEDGLWTLTFRQDDGNLFGDFNFRTKADINLGKALKASGVDLGDVTANLTFGRYSGETLDNAYSDPEGNHWQRVKTAGKYSTGLKVGYGKYATVQAIFDPTMNAGGGNNGKASYGFGVVSKPVDGVKAAVNFSRHGKSTQYKGYTAATNTTQASGNFEDYAIGVSADVDVNKFLNVDKLALDVSGYYTFRRFGTFDGKEDSKNKNNFGVAVQGGWDKIDGFVEVNYAQDNNDADGNGVGETWLKAQVNLGKLVPVEGLGLDAYYMQRSFDDTWFSVGADVSYKLGGVKYALKAEFTDVDVDKDNNHTTFRIRPSIDIVF